MLDGDFTLKGLTKPITLELEFNGINPGMGHGEVAGFDASVVVNRKDFGIDIDLPLETGGTVVGDKVTITLEIEALKQAVTPWRAERDWSALPAPHRLGAGVADPDDADDGRTPRPPVRRSRRRPRATVRGLSERLSSQCSTASAIATSSRPTEKRIIHWPRLAW